MVLSGIVGIIELCIAVLTSVISIPFKVNFKVIFFNALIPYCIGMFFLFVWFWLHPEYMKKSLRKKLHFKEYSKGDDYMRQILQFQKKYMDLKINKIKKEICRNNVQLIRDNEALQSI